MAALFKPGVLTTDGKALLAKWQAGGATPQITHAAIGSGSYTKTEDASTRTSLKAEKLRVGISSAAAAADGDTLNLRFVFSNDSVTTGFPVTEVGVFATDPDKGEVLYSISVSADESVADFFPAYSGNHSVSSIFDYYIKMSNAENVTILGGTGAFALADDMIQMQNRVNALEACGLVVVDGKLCVKYTKPTT